MPRRWVQEARNYLSAGHVPAAMSSMLHALEVIVGLAPPEHMRGDARDDAGGDAPPAPAPSPAASSPPAAAQPAAAQPIDAVAKLPDLEGDAGDQAGDDQAGDDQAGDDKPDKGSKKKRK